MDYQKFEKWCNFNKDKIDRYVFNKDVSDTGVSLTLLFGLILFYGLYKFFGYGGLFTIIGIVYIFIVFFIIVTKFDLPLKTNEIFACLLFKISNEIELMQSNKNIKELHQDLKNLKNISIYPIKTRVPSMCLFKKENSLQLKFFKLFYELPERIYSSISDANFDKTEMIENLRKLAYSIYCDADNKEETLNQVLIDNPSSKDLGFNFLKQISKFKNNNLFRAIFWTVILGIIFYFPYRCLGIDKNTLFGGFVVMLSPIIFSIFKK
ncbi:MAG: hypothetical protein WCX69_02015 [Candidatus Paceibacterota bacterium]